MKLQIDYIVDREEWSDEDYETQEPRSVILTESQLKYIVEKYGTVEIGEEVEIENIKKL